LKRYHAIIVAPEPDQTALRVSVLAQDIGDARRKLEQEYGENAVYGLHGDEEAPERYLARVVEH
jgi:hypothetical protein